MKNKENNGLYLVDSYEFHEFKYPLLPFTPLINLVQNPYNAYGNWHECLEILYVIDGIGNIMIDNEDYVVEKGDIVIANSNDVHRISSKTSVKYHGIIIDAAFCVQNGIDLEKIRFKTRIRDVKLEELIVKPLFEIKEARENSRMIPTARMHILELLIYLENNYLENEEDSRKSSQSVFIHRALKYINENFCKPVSLDDISKNVGVSKYYFLREFKLYTGHTVVTYINILRCAQAKRLLLTGSYSVGEVSRMCGYESLPYFTNVFKKYTGVLPSKYVKK